MHLDFVRVGQMCEFCPHLVGDGFIIRHSYISPITSAIPMNTPNALAVMAIAVSEFFLAFF